MPNSQINSRIYATQGDKRSLLGVRAMIGDKLYIAYIKGNQVVSYESYENLCKQMLADGPIGVIDPLTKTISWPSETA